MKLTAGPVLRGITYNGHCGVTVSYHRDFQPGSAQQVLELNEQDHASAEAVIEAASKFIESRGCCPQAVKLGGEGWLVLADSYDEARAGKETSRIPGIDVKPGRAEVVRGKIALVTGGAQGFGEGMVRGLTEAGAFVYIADLQMEKARALADELNREAGFTTALPLRADITDEESVKQLFEQVILHTGGLDICISNAGVLKAGSVKEMSLKDFEFVTSVDYTGFFLCTKHAARLLELQNRPTGRYSSDVIVISSKSGLEGSNRNGAYAGAKFGVIGLTQSYALELVEDNIKVNALCPGNFLDGPLWSDPQEGLFVQYFRSGKVPGAKSVKDVRRFYEGKVPMNRGCTTEDVMKTVFYVIEQEYETGQALPITGGQVMLN